MIIPNNMTFTENAKRIKNTVRIEDYISSLGIDINYEKNRCECPVCRGRKKDKMILNLNTQRVTCFAGCIKAGDIIELHAVINNLNNFEALNDLIKIYSIERVKLNNYKPVEKSEFLFKYKASEYLDKCLYELDKISFLKYELLEQFECVDYCYWLKDELNAKKRDLSYNKYNKDEIRYLYKKTTNFINIIKNIGGNQ